MSVVFALAWVQIDYVHPAKDVVLKLTPPSLVRCTCCFHSLCRYRYPAGKKKTLALPVGPGWNFEGSRKHHCKTTQASIK